MDNKNIRLPHGENCRYPRGYDCSLCMHRLQTVDFSIAETVLYLDAYPNCREALEYYNKLVCERKKIVEEYESKCGALTPLGNSGRDNWNWGEGPWPWEMNFPGNRHNAL